MIDQSPSLKITIPGHPLVLKNSKQIIVVRGRRLIKSNPKVEAYQHKAIAEIVEQLPRNFESFTGPVHMQAMFYGAWKSSNGNMPDLSNLYQLPEDLLESSGVIINDNQIESHDGSRRVCMCDSCDDRPLIKAGARKGERKPDCGAVKRCGYERVEIIIEGV